MSVDGLPRGEDGLAVGVVEVGEYLRYAVDAVGHVHGIRLVQACHDGLGGGYEYVFAIEVLEAFEHAQRDASRHEFAPRFGVDALDERVERQAVDAFHGAVYHEWQSGGYLA